ncbi:inositol polyphosphate multikinase [Salarias fasciatus]|uniref:Kinase n=1 Tax=Salarias fasciatus TaxID=181472 RepID=A0A672GUE4_SALFA|nr:inositol polyphosphate multikinase [Salarias fasciatus]
MSAAQPGALMEPSLALGRLELSPGPGTGTGPAAPRLPAGPRAPPGTGPPHLNGCVPLSHQVAGHKYGVDKVGILQHPDGTVLKQLQPPPRGPRERDFYSTVYAEDCRDPCLLDLQNHLPRYFGTWSSPDSPAELYLKLEDVTRRFAKPCIMDVKLGRRSYDPFASQEKREQQIRKYPHMEEVGFLLLGMRVYQVDRDAFDSYDQHYGRGLVKDTVKDGLARFFHNGVSLRKDAVASSICRVRRILQWFESQQQLVFYASSLLFVYEGLPCCSSSPSLSSPLSSSSVSSGDDGGGRAGPEAPAEPEVAEYNNNNIRAAPPWDYGPPTINTNHRKDCAKSRLHGNGGAAPTEETAQDSALCQEDNSAWKRSGELRRAPNGNGGVEGEGEGRSKSSEGEELQGEQVKRRAGDAAEDAEVEVRMIDFAHVFPSQSHDHGYIYGLKHLLTVLEHILCDAA